MRICLNMIVRNESQAIASCLNSVRQIIDYWVIVDTGSTDDTQQKVRQLLQDIPGELHQKPWINFSENRNEALELAKNKGDYLLFIDADEQLIINQPLDKSSLFADVYMATLNLPGDIQCWRPLLANNSLKWKWEGVLHETIQSNQAKQGKLLSGIYIDATSSHGHRSQNPHKFQHDIDILLYALKENPHNPHYLFYLSQSYAKINNLAKTLEYAEKRVALGRTSWQGFWSQLTIGKTYELLNYPREQIIQGYTESLNCRPSRAEPLYYLGRYYNRHNQPHLAYARLHEGLKIPFPSDPGFIEKWIYEYGLLLELATSAYFLGYYMEAEKLTEQVLAHPKLPLERRMFMKKNLSLLQTFSQKGFQVTLK